jgi:DNA ligase (NAD+)
MEIAMDNEQAQERMAYLLAEVRRHQDLYYRDARPEIDDRTYDALFDELQELERLYPGFASPDSPTRRVGSDLDNDFPEVEHPSPMLSLEKVYNTDDLREWIDKVGAIRDNTPSYVVEEKVDGSTIVLHYEEGLLARAVTRGDGYVGNDITANVQTIRDIPLRLKEPVSSVFRGEIYIEKDDFESFNDAMGNIYANPRNFAAGNLRRKHSRDVAAIPLRAFVYEGLRIDGEGQEHVRVLHRLSQLGFRVGETVGFFSSRYKHTSYTPIFKNRAWERGDMSMLYSFIEKHMQGRESLNYEIDGFVVKVNEYDIREGMGYTAHHPRWAMAYKFDAPQAVSVIEEIEAQVGRTGRVTPVARITPVWIAGSTVSNVTLHNQDYIHGLDAAVGDRVSVSKRGDVIPAIEDVLEKNSQGNRTYAIPDSCPICSTALVRDGAHQFCPNLECPARVFGRIAFFAARGQMDIENMGSETVKVLIEKKFIRDIPDIYSFDPAALVELEGFGEKKVRLLRDGIERSKAQPFSVVLTSLGLDEVGPRIAELLIESGYNSIEKLIDAARKKDPELFTTIQGIGPKTALKLIEQLNNPFIRNTIDRLKKAGLRFREEPSSAGETYAQIFLGQVWCVTGSFSNFKPRDAAMEEVKRRGGRVVAQVTGATTHLLVGENPGSKVEKARKLGSTLVYEKDFVNLLNGKKEDT